MAIHRLLGTMAPTAAPTTTPARDSSLSVGTISGLACLYNTLTSARAGGFKIRLKAGCFTNSIAQNPADIRALGFHSDSVPLARLSANTMRLTDSARGLLVSIDLPNTTAGNDVWVLAKRGDLSQFSVSFSDDAGDESVTWTVEDKTSIVQINRAVLREISTVVWPALVGATFTPQVTAPAMSAASVKPRLTLAEARRIEASRPTYPTDRDRLQATIAQAEDRRRSWN